MTEHRLQPQQQRQRAADIADEHHRVAPLDARVQLAQRVDQRRAHQRRIEQGNASVGHGAAFENSCRCSTTGPSATAGTYVSAPTRNTVPISSPTNSGPWVGILPTAAPERFFNAMLPARASTGTMVPKRPSHIATARPRL